MASPLPIFNNESRHAAKFTRIISHNAGSKSEGLPGEQRIIVADGLSIRFEIRKICPDVAGIGCRVGIKSGDIRNH